MIYLIRHGQSEGNELKRYCGVTDVQLSNRGRQQAASAGESLAGLGLRRIFTSPLKRAETTASIISDITGASKVTDRRLIEINFGIFENMTWDEMIEKYPAETEAWIKLGSRYIFPRGESYMAVVSRIGPFIDSLTDGDAVVSHFGVMQSILIYLGVADYDSVWEYHISNCDIITLDNGRLKEIIKCRL